ncbi:hypothetical protein FGIG_04264 [Fasciola gigantica]|uniref:Uncharacterized protein n=1 Tax=Fasciola gigantica TaxID=46835 RepID=A0A504YTW6_FASGI|nr:hypothetical protein FGIG_04264 [Fasciola gigantica]
MYFLFQYDPEYEMDYSIPNCGSVNLALFEITTLMATTSICEALKQCSKNELSKIMPHTHLFTYWMMGFEKQKVYVHIWAKGSEERNTETNIENLSTECIGELEHTTAYNE